MKIKNDRWEHNQEALDNPQPGDYWHEMFCPYFIVVKVDGEKITVLSCLGGPNSFSRKGELNARVDNIDGTWSFDYSRHMVVDKAWIAKAVKYGSIEGFVADVVRDEKRQKIVEEWVEYQYHALMKQILELGPHVSKYMLTNTAD